MKFIARLTVLIYVTLIMFLGSTMVLFALHLLKFKSVSMLLTAFYTDDSLRFGLLLFGAVLLLLNFIFYKIFSVNVHRDKVVAFDNPSGRVTVSLFALEDTVKRLISKITEVRDARVIVEVSKKGLQVRIKLALNSETNIPDLTSRLQGSIKKKVQEIIGIDESVEITIYVGKIVSSGAKGKKVEEKDKMEEGLEPNIPFHGYRA